MKSKCDWHAVWARLRELASHETLWHADQDRSLAWIAKQLQEQPGVLIADEVGLGKTRLAIALAVCVAASGGRIAIMIPPGLTYQWRDEELRGFMNQLAALNLPWVPSDVTTKILRTYPDLFEGGPGLPAYPLSAHAPFVFMSHRFGLPYGMSSLKRDELWGLPFALKLKLVKDGRLVRNAKWLDLSPGQTEAVDWLAGHIPNTLRDRVTAGVLSKVSTDVFKDTEAMVLFRNLIGELVGDFDLVVIDEAHKSRAGSDALEASDKQALTILQSRLTLCLDDIILRPGSTSRQAKRLALTATPMEMDAKQWGDVLVRLGLGSTEVKRLKTIVQDFADAVKAIRTGSPNELTRLSNASAAFQDALQPIVTRRVWRDHPTVKDFGPYALEPDAAHPHRRMLSTIVALGDLSADERIRLACAEGLAAASRGMRTHTATKSAGSRHAQALPLISELAAESMTPAGSDSEDVDQETATSTSEQAKRQRQGYWLSALGRLSEDMGELTQEPSWSLQWHPKVHRAIRLIEDLVAQNKKVLVFAEFLEPMRALDRALNIRHYLRQVRDRKPILLPAGFRSDDPDLRRWLTHEELAFSPAQIASFEADAAILATRYSNDRAALREACQSAANDFFAQARPQPVTLHASTMDTVVTWLVQQLCTQESETETGSKSRRRQMYEMALARLPTLQDSDVAGKTAADDADAQRPFDWETAIREQEEDLEKDQSGRYVFRMSPFSQRLYGKTKPSTRRVRQSAFNDVQLNPQVLIGQSAVASEGLNLHRACHSVVLFHLDWNPGRIEQQIGRVDRQGSAWMAAFKKWKNEGAAGDVPYIDVHTIALEGTYDSFRTEVVNERAKVLRSQLFGEILPAEQLRRLPEDVQAAIANIQIDFRPIRASVPASP